MLDGENSSMSDKKSPKPKILLAEDDDAMRRFLEITLQRADYTVVSAEDGLAAMQIALTEKFDAVITDAVMPNLTGHDLCRILRRDPNFKDAPIIILSGLEQEVSANVEHDCADFYLVKGAKLKDDLVKKLAELIGAGS
ncbi:MAG: response regulator [Pyrinomonadaceae bacterium]|nr:response regulator [Pyrinomonadaceae bacterium]